MNATTISAPRLTRPNVVRVDNRRPRGHGGRNNLIGLAFILPAVAFFGVFIAYPLIQTVYLSMTSSNGLGTTTFVGFRNFGLMVSDPTFLTAIRVTLTFTIVSTILQTAIPLCLALLIYYGPVKSRVLYRTLFFLPAAISLTVTGLLWRLGLNPEVGFVNKLLDSLGLSNLVQPWLGNTTTVLPAVILVSLWQASGLYMLILYAGLGNIDPAISESARVDGAGPFREAWSITIPMLRPVIEVVVMLNIIHGLKMFDLNYVMSNGGPLHASETLSSYTYLVTFGNSSGAISAFGYGAAISLVVFVISAIATLLLYRARRSD